MSDEVMTDEETICAWMEQKPKGSWLRDVQPTWWYYSTFELPTGWHVKTLDLDALHEVEAKLQSGARDATVIEPCILRNRYIAALSESVGNADTWHATAAQKIKALATVLRGSK